MRWLSPQSPSLPEVNYGVDAWLNSETGLEESTVLAVHLFAAFSEGGCILCGSIIRCVAFGTEIPQR